MQEPIIIGRAVLRHPGTHLPAMLYQFIENLPNGSSCHDVYLFA
jgi:hypothetical protein